MVKKNRISVPKELYILTKLAFCSVPHLLCRDPAWGSASSVVWQSLVVTLRACGFHPFLFSRSNQKRLFFCLIFPSNSPWQTYSQSPHDLAQKRKQWIVFREGIKTIDLCFSNENGREGGRPGPINGINWLLEPTNAGLGLSTSAVRRR